MRRWEAVLLAAGASSRMGRSKALLPWERGTLLEGQIREILATRVRHLVVVLGCEAERIAKAVGLDLSEGGTMAGGEGKTTGYKESGATPSGPVRTTVHKESGPAPDEQQLSVVRNRRWETGKCSSIRCGVQRTSARATDLLIVAVDQPARAEIVEALMSAHELLGADATVPRFAGKGGHPVVFRHILKERLMNLSEKREGLKGLFRDLKSTGRVGYVDLAAPAVLWNLNTPDDL